MVHLGFKLEMRGTARENKELIDGMADIVIHDYIKLPACIHKIYREADHQESQHPLRSDSKFDLRTVIQCKEGQVVSYNNTPPMYL